MAGIRKFFNQEIGDFQGWHIHSRLRENSFESPDIQAVFGTGERKIHLAECAVRNFLREENRVSFTPDELKHLQAANDSYQAALSNLPNLPRIKTLEELRRESHANSSGHRESLHHIAEHFTKK